MYYLMSSFPVRTADELFVTGKAVRDKAASPQFELSKIESHAPSQVNMQTQTPYELKTTVL